MKRIPILYLAIAIVIWSVFCISSLGSAQTGPQKPLRQRLAQVGLRAKQVELPLVRDQGGFGNIRIDWKKLGLSKEQTEEIRQKRRDFQVQTAGIRRELTFAQQDLRLEIAKDPSDRARIDIILEHISTLSQQMSEAAIQNVLAMKSILTPDQLEKIDGLRSQIPAELRRLQLTAEQRAKIREGMESSREENRKLTEDLQELKAALRETLLTQDVDSKSLNQLQADIAEKEFARQKLRVDRTLEMKEILTSEQLKLWQRVRIKRSRNAPEGRRNG
jgi:Spy/CpxP family protein refolding chaperone